MATICPLCSKKGKRVEMNATRLPQPDFTTEGDRFPGEIIGVPAVYHAHTKWTCPACDYSQCE